MAEWVSTTSGYLWQNGLAVVPLVLMVAVATRVLPCRPATRHMMWVMVLLWLIAPPILPGVENPWAETVVESAPAGAPKVGSDHIIENPPPASLGMGHPALAGQPPVAPVGTPIERLTEYRNEKPPVRVTPHVARGLPKTHKTKTMEASAPLPKLPSPWRTARADAAGQSLLAQVCDAAGLPPDVEQSTAGLATGQWGPYCPAAEEVEETCRAEPTRQPLPSFARDTLLKSERSVRNHPQDLPEVPPARKPRTQSPLLADAAPTMRLPETSERSMTKPEAAGPPLPASVIDLIEEDRAAQVVPWQQWAGVALRMRDDLASLPPVPTDIWIGGVVVLLLVAGVRVIRFRHLVRNATVPSSGTSALVAEVCRCAGLRRSPEVWMVEGTLSPMVWCVLRPRLLIPMRLWGDLDEIGRRAVIMHELAHLRRRDHWVLWIENAVGGLFWWHPLVWWVRRRVHLEAEYCCDAWVTTLLPRTRRAYAEALLRTRQYVGENGSIVPAMGMGISSGRAKRFARRLTMVMTNTTKPGVSVWGVSLVLLIAATGWLASPARSCPEEDAKKHECAKAAAGCDKAECPKASAVVAPVMRVQAAPVGIPVPSQTSYERHMAAKAFGGTVAPVAQPVVVATPQPGVFVPAIAQSVGGWVTAAGDDDEEGKAKKKRKAEGDARVEALEAQLEALGEQLERLAEQLEATKGGDGRSDDDDDDASRMRVRTPRPPRAPRAPRAPMAAQPGMPAMPPMPPQSPQGHGPHGQMEMRTPFPTEFPKAGQTWADVSEEETEWQTYKISEGKLEDFTKLMSRQDVPILVRAQDEAIEIQATPRQHRIINGFLQLIDPSDERAQADHERGLFGAIPGHGFGELGALRVFGVGAEGHGHSSGVGACGGDCSKCECDKCKEVKAHRKQAEKIRAEARQMSTELRAKAEGDAGRARAEAQERAREVRDRLRQEARKIRVEARNQEEVRRALEREAETLREQAERMREKAERARERAQQLRERSEESTEPQGAIMEHIDVLERTADALTEHGAEIAAKADEVLSFGDTVVADEQTLEQHADEVDVRAETIDEIAGSVDHLEVGPELAESIAQLAREIETAVGLANCDPSWISAISDLEAVELAQPNFEALKELEMIRAAETEAVETANAEAHQAVIEAMRAAELEGAEVRERASEAALEAQLKEESIRKEAIEAVLQAEQEKAEADKAADDDGGDEENPEEE